MRPTLLLLGLLILGARALAEPTAKLRDDEGGVLPGHWLDLRLAVDPKGTPLAAEGLEVEPAPVAGVEFGAAIVPAPDADGAFKKPFVIRIPAKPGKGGPFDVSVELRGKTAAGTAFGVRATGKVEAWAEKRHVDATVALKAPAVAGVANAIVVKATVADGYHVYGSATKDGIPVTGSLVPAPGARGAPPWSGGGPASPKGDHLEHGFGFEIPFTPARAGKVELRVQVVWQACTEFLCDPNGIAYLPLAFEAEGASGAGGGGEAEPGVTVPPEDPGAPMKPNGSGGSAQEVPGSAEPANDLAKGSIWDLIGLAIGAGIIALLMPCTYPLIPITISFFTKQADAHHRSVVPLALAYGAGIVAIFTLIGVAVSTAFVAGDTILNVAAGWHLNLVFALLFLAFGLSLLGLFDIRLPSFFDDIAAKASGTGGYLSVFVMGLTLVITSFTCTVPFVGGLLVFAAKDGQAARAILAMAVFGLTMAVPFVVLSLSPKGFQALPKSGEWMKRLKVTLGIVELGLVLKFVSNVDIARSWFFIDREMFLVLWAISFLAAGLYLLGLFDLFARGVRWTLSMGRAVAGLLMLGITAVLAYGATGPGLDQVLGENVGAKVESFLPQFKADYGRAFLAVAHDYDEGVRIAKEKDAPIFLHFTGYT